MSTPSPVPTPEVTPSQTVGPFFEGCLLREDMRCHNVLVTEETEGTRIRVIGHVYDGDGQPVPDAVLEIWQANAAGRYNHPADVTDAPLTLPSRVGGEAALLMTARSSLIPSSRDVYPSTTARCRPHTSAWRYLPADY